MKKTFGLGGYVGGTVKAGTVAPPLPFHLTPKGFVVGRLPTVWTKGTK